MGCTSTKAPAQAPISSPSAEHTLLGPVPVSPGKETVKDEVALSPASFEGRWSGGTIKGPFLAWPDGAVSEVHVDKKARKIKVRIEAGRLTGELQDDDRISWSNGEVWTRHHVCAAFFEHEGFIEGPDVLVLTMTPEEAKCKACTMPNCVGFTYGAASGEDMPVRVHFKSKWNICGAVGEWTSHKKEEVPCAVGDAVMAVFTPNDRRYAATIASISPDNTITVNWLDGGKTHRTLPASKVFKDGVARSSSKVRTAGLAEAEAEDSAKDNDPTCQSRVIALDDQSGLPHCSGWRRFLEQESMMSNDGEKEQQEPAVRPSQESRDGTDCCMVSHDVNGPATVEAHVPSRNPQKKERCSPCC